MFYGDNECDSDQCFAENSEDLDYDYFYYQESLFERYQNCVHPTLNDTFFYIIPLFLVSVTCNIAAGISK